MAQTKAEIEAQRQYFERANGPVAGSRSTFGKQPNKLFREMQQTGRIPSTFKSWDDAEQQFLAVVASGKSPKQAREQLGLTYSNVIGHPYFDVVLDRHTGAKRGFNPRAVNEDFHPIAEAELRKREGDAAVDTWRGQLKDGWGDYKTKSAYDPMTMSAKDEAQQVRQYLTEAFGKGKDPFDRGQQFHRGHGFSASQSGGSVELTDLFPEWGPYNVDGHQSLPGNPRYHPDNMHELNISSTTEQAYYNNKLNREGLTINPRETMQPGAMMAADENLNQIDGTKTSRPTGYAVSAATEQNPGVSENALAAQQRRRDELAAQIGADGPRQARNQANSQSTLMDVTQTTGGEVKVIKPANRSVTVVGTNGRPSTQYLDELSKLPPGQQAEAVTKAVEMGVPRSFFPNRLMNPTTLAIGGSMPGVAGAIFDGMALADSINAPKVTLRQQLSSALNGVSGATGLSALAPTPAAPILGAVSMGTGLAATAVERRVDKKIIPAIKKAEQIKQALDPLAPLKKKAGNELKFWGGQFLKSLKIGK